MCLSIDQPLIPKAACFWILGEGHSASLGASLSRRHQDTKKSPCSERRRPRRHHRFAPVSALPPSLPLMSLRAACGRQCWFAFFPECLTLRAAIMQPTAQKPKLLGSQPAPAGMCSCMPDSIASLPIRIPAWIATSLGSLRWGCSMQGGDLRGGISRINS